MILSTKLSLLVEVECNAERNGYFKQKFDDIKNYIIKEE